MALYDMHCHLDFADNDKQVAADSQGYGIKALCDTVVPSSFVSASEQLKPWDNIAVALGMHPWWIAQGRVSTADVLHFESLMGTTPFIGEIGLDFHGKYSDSRDHQLEILCRILEGLKASEERKVVFLHSVKATTETLDLLERYGTLDQHTCAFHWFSGSHDEFGRALSLGCSFSVGMRMLATDKGREFAQAIPLERLMIETDSPAHEGMMWSADAWHQELANTVSDLAELRQMKKDELERALEANSSALLGF